MTGSVAALAVIWGCSPKAISDDDDSSHSNKGGMSAGGSAGSGSGNTTSTAGHGTGGTGTGGSTGGSVATGGATATGGSVGTTGGTTGGSVASGGMPGTGGSVVSSGGMPGTGGSVSMAGSGTGAVAGSGTSGSAGTGTTGTNPPGYWSEGDWHGCAWTGIDTDTTATMRTTVSPQDFTMGQAMNGSYCAMGSVGNTYASVALLGFNLDQDSATANCTYDPNAASADGPPGVALQKTGLAINFSKTGAFTLRVQIQAQDGATNADHRWCYTITDAAGPVFAPYSMFNTKCWDGTGTNYDGTTPISAVVFLVPGATSTTPYNFCINGFAAGDSAADAPTGGTQGSLTGTIGGSGSTDLDFQRVKVKVDGHSYIIQNNNWGNPSGSDQTLTYKDNSFTVSNMTGSGSSAPASFPSIYIGANGDTQMGTYDTSSDDHLPKQISAITSVNTSFKYTLGSGQMNAAYDIWFASSPPTACYGDGVSGFVMVWFHSPSDFHPIGSSMATAMIDGHAWNVWVGPRGGTGSSNGSCQVSNQNAPVVSYVSASGDVNDVSAFDLKPFFTDAASHGISSSWYLTDVFGGFEIWNGGNGAAVQNFTAIVAP
ncbi:MAG TPA: hypothetical protein VMI54_26150 [Polyangiaceae bacterium]|nr:hypothetical protein [Polyangiaceae bacterium]